MHTHRYTRTLTHKQTNELDCTRTSLDWNSFVMAKKVSVASVGFSGVPWATTHTHPNYPNT